ncbi:uncharacterized protein [Dermacentor andersoni]|uniref:uncharacterized protein isoform X1 n=1 Tax=Dermacentor andersoni TaxID=34620 RepID=UPI002417FA51|nr:uncharacterized protein LOC126528913 isoform X1 [Dermacentor andersoni]
MRKYALYGIVVILLTLTDQADLKRTDPCGGKSGVVTTSKSAATAARIMAKCGNRLALKFNISADAVLKILPKCCIIAHLCYSQVQGTVKKTMQSDLVKCGRAYSLFMASAFPEVLKVPVEDVERMFKQIQRCIGADIPLDKHIMLGMIRYVRGIFFVA